MYENATAAKIMQDEKLQVWAIQAEGETKLTLPPYMTEKEVMDVRNRLKEAELHGFNRGLMQNIEVIKELENKIRELRKTNNELSKILLKYQEDLDVLD